MSARNIKKNPVPDPPKHFNGRNTRDWCRGKKDVEHVKVWKNGAGLRLHHGSGLPWREELICSNCGKRFESRRKRYTPGVLARTYRELAGKTQQELADMVGLTLTRLAAIEGDRTTIALVEVEKIAVALNLRFEINFANMPMRISDHEPVGFW